MQASWSPSKPWNQIAWKKKQQENLTNDKNRKCSPMLNANHHQRI